MEASFVTKARQAKAKLNTNEFILRFFLPYIQG